VVSARHYRWIRETLHLANIDHWDIAFSNAFGGSVAHPGELLKSRTQGGRDLVLSSGEELPLGAAAPPPQLEGGEGDARRKGGKDSKGGGKKGKDYGGKNGGGKGKDKGGKGMKGAFGGKGKGMPNYANFAPMPPPPLNAQMYPIEMQRQMLGEKLYMTVQPMVSTPMIAQKVTGMLLELPMPELMPLLGPSPSERQLLKQRVDEAMEVLEAEEGQGAK